MEKYNLHAFSLLKLLSLLYISCEIKSFLLIIGLQNNLALVIFNMKIIYTLVAHLSISVQGST